MSNNINDIEKEEVLNLFKKLRERYEVRFKSLKIYKKKHREIDYFCFLQALSQLPTCLQEICMKVSEETYEDVERIINKERHMKEIRKKLRRLTTLIGSRELELDNPY